MVLLVRRVGVDDDRGWAMGYFGGKGVPLFTYTVPAKEDRGPEDGKKAKWSYQNHKLAGQALEWLVPMHIGAVGYYYLFKKINVLKRIL